MNVSIRVGLFLFVFVSLTLVLSLSRSKPSHSRGSRLQRPEAQMVYYDSEVSRKMMFSSDASAPEEMNENFHEDDGDRSQEIPETSQRMVIKTASISVVTSEIKNTEASITDFVIKRKGYVVSSNWGIDYSTISVRVPFDQFDETLKFVRSISDLVENEIVSGQDVTEQFVDQKARAENMQAVHNRLLKLIERASEVKDIIILERELASVTEKLESYKARMEFLQKSSSTSLININLRVPNLAPNPFVWSPLQTFQRAFQDLYNFLQNVIDVLIYSLVFSIPITVILLFCYPFARSIYLRYKSYDTIKSNN